MNIILRVRRDQLQNILDGIQTVHLCSYLPPSLTPGSTIYLCNQGKIYGHCSFSHASTMPPAGLQRTQWLESIAALTSLSTADTMRLIFRWPVPHVWHLRYPVRYATPRHHQGPAVNSYKYTAISPPPHETHPALANFLLFLQNR